MLSVAETDVTVSVTSAPLTVILIASYFKYLYVLSDTVSPRPVDIASHFATRVLRDTEVSTVMTISPVTLDMLIIWTPLITLTAVDDRSAPPIVTVILVTL